MKFPAESALVLRRRSAWEAADSGILLWRENFADFILLFALPIWISAFALRLTPEFLRPWSYLILWWCKPFFDRFALQVIAVRFFEPGAGFRRLFRGLGGFVLRGLGGDLLWRRFSPWRSSRMPVRLLEGNRGKKLRKRKKFLEPGGLDFCLLVTVLALALEGILLGGELLFAWMMANMFRPDLGFTLLAFAARFELFVFAAYCFNFMLIESLYVCMGFGLYLNSRVEMEGWDIQLLFQGFTSRGGAGKASGREAFIRRAGPVSLLCLLLAVPAAAQDADQAGESGEESPAVKVLIPGPREAPRLLEGGDLPLFSGGEAPLEDLEAILASPDFGGMVKGWGIRFKETKDEEPETGEAVSLGDGPWTQRIRRLLASFLRILLVLAIVGGAAFSLYRLFRAVPAAPSRDRALCRGLGGSPPEEPPALFGRAEELHRRGRFREAWAACLGGILAAWDRRGLRFPPGATEYDCLALVRAGGEGEERVLGFEVLIRRWVRFAYAGQRPEEGAFREALVFGFSLLESPERAPRG
jgi:hypothetical protein